MGRLPGILQNTSIYRKGAHTQENTVYQLLKREGALSRENTVYFALTLMRNTTNVATMNAIPNEIKVLTEKATICESCKSASCS